MTLSNVLKKRENRERNTKTHKEENEGDNMRGLTEIID